MLFSSTESSADDLNSTPVNSIVKRLFRKSELSIRITVRKRHDFYNLELIGKGDFGTVYRCVNRVDSRVYAIKRSQPLTRNKIAQKRANNEVNANVLLRKHKHVVKYYLSWIENDCMNIQQEYCNGGDLAAVIARMNNEMTTFTEKEICRIILHVANGLRLVHVIDDFSKSKNAYFQKQKRNKIITFCISVLSAATFMVAN